eukprot:c6296_g1_i1 orf=2-643(-)
MQTFRAQTQGFVKGFFCPGKQHTIKNSRVLLLGLEDALPLLEQGLLPQPSVEEFARFLHKSRKEKNGELVLRLRAYMCKSGLDSHKQLGNYLVPMLVGIGNLHYAQQVFDRLVYGNEWSCYCLITGYIKCGKPHLAFIVYERMHEDGFASPSGHILVALLKVCAELKDFGRGLEIHVEAARTALLENNPYVGSALVDFYGKCGALAVAQQVFDK